MHKALYDFLNDDTLEYVYLIPFHWYKHKPSAVYIYLYLHIEYGHFKRAFR